MKERPFSDVSYEAFLREERLMGSRCKECNALFLPPRPICTECHHSGMEWIEIEGKGKLSAFTCIAIAPPAMIAEGYDRKHPYCSGVVELDEGVRIVARIEDVDTNKPENINVGMPVRAKFLHRGEGEDRRTVLAFRPL